MSFLSLKFILCLYVCTHAWACAHMCVPLPVLVETKGFGGCLLCCSLPYIWTRVSLNLDPTYSASLAGQWAACIYLCPLPQQRSNRLQMCTARTIFCGAGELKSPSLNLYGVLWDGSACKSICHASLSTWVESTDLMWRWIKRTDFTTCSLDLQTVQADMFSSIMCILRPQLKIYF